MIALRRAFTFGALTFLLSTACADVDPPTETEDAEVVAADANLKRELAALELWRV